MKAPKSLDTRLNDVKYEQYVNNLHDRLPQLTDPSDIDCKRWPWELLQNAKDTVVKRSNPNDRFVDIVIKLTAAGAIKVPMAPMLQEAMTMAFSSKPEILDMYKVDKKHLSDYKEFVAAVSGSKSNSMQANSVISKNRNRYWYYHYSMTNARNNRPNPVK
jgi:hypothetical protein